MIDCGEFRSALGRLELQYANHRTLDPQLPPLLREAVAESVIQRFETCYDSLWKVLKRHLVETLGLPRVPNSPKPLFRLAAENGLLPSPVERWLEYADARTGTAHDSDGTKAGHCLTLMGSVIPDAIALHHTMSGRPWP